MRKQKWTSTEIRQIFMLGEKLSSIGTLFNAENRGDIPASSRILRGSVSVRHWDLIDLPKIGEKYGFLEKPKKQIVICIHVPKGGDGKTTTAFNFGAIFGLNGLKTLIIPLDILRSMTMTLLPGEDLESLHGLYSHLFSGVPLTEVIRKTSLPTLDIIPEAADLNVLEQRLSFEERKIDIFQNLIREKLNDYDVIIFDTSPSWNRLIENALTAASIVLCPVACRSGTAKSLFNNLSLIFNFQKEFNIKWDRFFMLPTMLNRTLQSQRLYDGYKESYSKYILKTPIPFTVTADESDFLNMTALEYSPKSEVAKAYLQSAKEIWDRINGD